MTELAIGRPLKAPGLAETGVDDELVVLHLGSYRAITLNRSARAVWERCDGTRTPETLISELVEDFDADPSEIEKDVRALLRRLRAEGFLVDHAVRSPS